MAAVTELTDWNEESSWMLLQRTRQKIDRGGLDQGDHRGGGKKKWFDAGSVLMAETTGFANVLSVQSEGKTDIKDRSSF